MHPNMEMAKGPDEHIVEAELLFSIRKKDY